MAYHSKYSGAEVDSLLDKIKDDEVGSIDSSLSTTSENSVQNKVITEELNKKANKTDIATINGQPLTNGGNIEVITDAYDDTEINSKLTELQTEINSKQEALTLTVKDNGNIVLANIQGQSKEFMPATPSGDPMHWAYVAAGAEYNDTGADIEKTGMYGDTIIHKAGYWYLNELGDITNDEMRSIYLYANIDNSAKGVAKLLNGITTRTNIATWCGTYNSKIRDGQIFGYASNIITALLRDADVHYTDTNVSYMFIGCNKLEKVFPTIDATSTTAFNGAFETATNLKEIRLKNIKASVSFKMSTLLSKSSILYMIQNDASTSAITIALHPDAYSRAIADADILAALEQHTNISLASA